MADTEFSGISETAEYLDQSRIILQAEQWETLPFAEV